MRASILLCFAMGCAVDASSQRLPPGDETPPITITRTAIDRPVTTVEIRQQDQQSAICVLAAELPPDQICSLMCDPDAMSAELVAEGKPSGTCYDFTCPLPDGSRALVGVCLPPS